MPGRKVTLTPDRIAEDIKKAEVYVNVLTTHLQALARQLRKAIRARDELKKVFGKSLK